MPSPLYPTGPSALLLVGGSRRGRVNAVHANGGPRRDPIGLYRHSIGVVARSDPVGDPMNRARGLSGDGPVLRGIEAGIHGCRRLYDHGFGATHRTIEKFSKLDLPTTQIFHAHTHSDDVYGRTRIGPDEVLGEQPQWSILRQSLSEDANDVVARALELGKSIVRLGLETLDVGARL